MTALSTNGHENGIACTIAHVNGLKHGPTNGHTNGHTNDHTNGHSETKNVNGDAQTFRNPSLQVTPDHQLKLVDAPIEEPGPGQVTLQIKCSGICGWVAHNSPGLQKKKFC